MTKLRNGLLSIGSFTESLRDADGHVFESLIQYPLVFLDLSELSERFNSQTVYKSKEDMFYAVCCYIGARKSGTTSLENMTRVVSSILTHASEMAV